MQLRRDVICGLVREEGLIPRFRYASSKKHRQGKRPLVLPIKHNLQRPDHIGGIDEGVADLFR